MIQLVGIPDRFKVKHYMSNKMVLKNTREAINLIKNKEYKNIVPDMLL